MAAFAPRIGSVDSPDSMCGFGYKSLVIMSGYNVVIVQKQDRNWVNLVIWYGTFMLEYLLV